MIKAIAGFFRTLLLLALLVLVGYNILETRKLQAEVALLRKQAAGKQMRLSQTPYGKAETDIRSEVASRFVPNWAKEAQIHVERARVFLRTKRYEEARTEAEQALALVQKNKQAAEKQSAQTVQKWHRTAETVSAQATTLWNQINRSARMNKQP